MKELKIKINIEISEKYRDIKVWRVIFNYSRNNTLTNS